MKRITKYQANDGSVWSCSEDAVERDELIEKVNEAMEPLGSFDASRIANGDYVQHRVRDFLLAKENLTDLSLPCYSERIQDSSKISLYDTHQSYLWEYLSRLFSGKHPLVDAWARMCSIDDNFKEYNQQYYARHPEEAHGKCVKDYRKEAK